MHDIDPALITLAVRCMVRGLPVPKQVLEQLGEQVLSELQEAHDATHTTADSGASSG